MIGIVHGGGRPQVQEKVNLGSRWTAPRDGILVCTGRAQANSAYMFIRDETEGTYVGMQTIANNQHYGMITAPIISGHTYEVRRSSWQIQNDLFIYET